MAKLGLFIFVFSQYNDKYITKFDYKIINGGLGFKPGNGRRRRIHSAMAASWISLFAESFFVQEKLLKRSSWNVSGVTVKMLLSVSVGSFPIPIHYWRTQQKQTRGNLTKKVETVNLWKSTTTSVTRKIAKCLLKLPKTDFTREMIDFDTFTKIA